MYLRLPMTYRSRAEIHCSLLIPTVGAFMRTIRKISTALDLRLMCVVRTPRGNLGSCRAHLIPDWLAFLDKGSLDFFWIYLRLIPAHRAAYSGHTKFE
jgi:hypothetical protein